MKRDVSKRITESVDIRTVVIDIPLDEIEEHMPKLPATVVDAFKLDGDRWRIRVNADTGQIENWPAQEKVTDIYCKPRDAGTYQLLDAAGKIVAEIEGDYVPHGVVPGEDGDYLGMTISESGIIVNWPKEPDVSAFFENEER